MPEFTPGPWKTTNTIGNKPAVESADEKAHFVICYMPFLTKETWANARLISAAPDMLDALERLLPALVDEHGVPYEQDLEDRINAAKAVIAKAKGE